MNWFSIARRAHSLVPVSIGVPARQLYCRARGYFYRGDAVACPCCGGRYAHFLSIGSPPRPAACPGCDSRERHRLLYLYLEQRTNLFHDRLRVLHFAPEDCLQPALLRNGNLEYVTADRAAHAAALRIDITRIDLPDESFDVILCSHVLEHVDDDDRAMRELHRVLRPGGWAILQVPLDATRERTFEDPQVTDPRERERLFGQWDHVRVYGRDYPQKLRNAGFAVDVVSFAEQLGPEGIRGFGLDPTEQVHHCRRAA